MPGLKLGFALLCAAAAIGGLLAIAYLRGRPVRPRLALLHGALGAAGLAALLRALRRGLPMSAMGTGGFGQAAALLLGLALALGVWFALRRCRPAGALVGAHAGLAIAALVLMLTLVALG